MENLATRSMQPDAQMRAARLGMWSALGVGVGIIVSGPLGMLVVALVQPQPPWHDAQRLARMFHPIQTLPFVAGFVLITTLVMLIGALHALADTALRARTSAALAFAGAFCALATLNYSAQTLLVPWLATHYEPANAGLIAMWSMVNPDSLAWALEMWAYAWIGVATWLAAPVFGISGAERTARVTFVGNGVISVASALFTQAAPGWAQSPAGLVCFAFWNVWMLVMAYAAFVALRHRSVAPTTFL